MSGPIRIVGFALLAAWGAAASAQTDQVRERGDNAQLWYSQNDMVVGGRYANLSVQIYPTWPPSDTMQISYSGQECTISYCAEWWPGYTFCGCDYWSTINFGGGGQFPAAAFQISPQGVGQLDLEAGQITGWSYGDCPGLHLTATPSGEWHWSENGQITVETPTDVTRAVSRDDEWRTTLTGSACSMAVVPPGTGTGFIRRSDWNRVFRELKP